MEIVVEDNREGEEIELESNVARSLEVTKHALVGKLISDKAQNRKVTKSMIIKSWGSPKGLHIIDLQENTYLFNFSEPATPRRIMEDAPWNILGSLLCLHRWTPDLTLHEVDFSYSPFWIQIHGVPLQWFSTDNARRIASKVGEVEMVEDPFVGNKIVRGFMRARVQVEINKPLITGFWLPRKDLPKTWICIYYEKLQDFCYNCGRLGHGQKDCMEEKAMALWNSERPRYGPTLGVSPLKPLTTVIAAMSNPETWGGSSHARVKEGGEKRGLESIGIHRWEKYREERDDNIKQKGDALMKVAAAEMIGNQNSTVSVRVGVRDSEKWGTARDMEIRESGDTMEAKQQHEGASGLKKRSMQNEEKKKDGPDVNEGPSVSLARIDLKEGIIRPGLGPADIEDIGLEKEDIGLSKPVVILDVASPNLDQMRVGKEIGLLGLDIELSAEQINECRTRMLNSYPSGKSESCKGKEIVIWHPRDKQKHKIEPEYIVEFPEELIKEEETEEISCVNITATEETNVLSDKLQQRLFLKRTRIDEEEGDKNSGKRHKLQIEEGVRCEGTGMEVENKMIDETGEMAEEAGHNQPQQGP